MKWQCGWAHNIRWNIAASIHKLTWFCMYYHYCSILSEMWGIRPVTGFQAESHQSALDVGCRCSVSLHTVYLLYYVCVKTFNSSRSKYMCDHYHYWTLSELWGIRPVTGFQAESHQSALDVGCRCSVSSHTVYLLYYIVWRPLDEVGQNINISCFLGCLKVHLCNP